tara:strand:- start:925 stop:1317 length:393 start_codon:yes stop_codon:yes gene_type:complete
MNPILWNYYKQIILLNLPTDISEYIFSFVKESIKIDITNEKIYKLVKFQTTKNTIKPYTNFRNQITIHKNISPFKFDKQIYIKLIEKQIRLCKSDIKYKFSHECCNGKGLVFKQAIFNKKGCYIIPENYN